MTELTLEQKLQAMRDKFRESLADRIVQIDIHWDAACNGDEEARITLHRLVHSLAGSGATFGFTKVSEQSKILENAIEKVAAGPQITASAEVVNGLEQVRQVVSIASNNGEDADAKPVATFSKRQVLDRRLVYLAEDAREETEKLAEQIAHFGYEVERFTDLSKLYAAVERQIPLAIVTDVVFAEGSFAGIDMIERIAKEIGGDVPVYFVSTLDDMSARLRAVRAGGRAYLNRPVEAATLVDWLDRLSNVDRSDSGSGCR